ncbi:hypothetical protein LINGRAHAP2_LOCUS30565 [Linum grandiflorum]
MAVIQRVSTQLWQLMLAWCIFLVILIALAMKNFIKP